MSGDFSRNTFKRRNNYSLVRMQQGRLLSDADWNEQGDLLRSAQRKSTADIIGHAGFPQDDPGFKLTADSSGELLIQPGTAYVGGVRHFALAPAELSIEVLADNGANTIWKITSGVDITNDDLLAIDTSITANTHRASHVDTSEDGVRSFRATPPLPAGTSKLYKPLTVNSQPFAPSGTQPAQNGAYIAFLKSTEIPITALDAPHIREVAFDGPDTATRDQTIWQVQLHSEETLLDRGLNAEQLTCPALAEGIDPVRGNNQPGTLRARAELVGLSSGPCTLPPAAGYRSRENQLYRVEIHNTGSDTATFKWSRDNAIHRTFYPNIDGTVLEVESAGRDEHSKLTAENWIEIKDQASLCCGAPGFFARISEVVGNRISIAEILHPETLDPVVDGSGEPDITALPSAAFITRWEGGKPVSIALNTWSELENGLQIDFGNGYFQQGDFWTIPARAITGDIEWPTDSATGDSIFEPPEGPRRDYAALARLTKSDAGWSIEDCRPAFPTAVRSLQFLYCSGDGQEVMPDPLNPITRVAVPKPLTVTVARGHEPVQGETIRFEVIEGDGELEGGLKVREVSTNSIGLAEVNWKLDTRTPTQSVKATRLNAAGVKTHTPIIFNANLSRANKTSFDPKNIANLANANTVQKAIEKLAGLQQAGCSTHIIAPNAGWEQLLENLPAGTNVSICFSPGTYTLQRAVNLSNLGHVDFHGANAGTAIIEIDRSESAFKFISCASVTLRHMSVSTPASGTGVTQKGNRQGTLDFTECGEVTIEDCRLSCGAATSPERTCITSRGNLDGDKPPTPSKTVVIRNNHIRVGYMQEGILVTDAIDTDIANNHIDVISRKRSSINIKALLADRKLMARIITSLVQRPVLGKLPSKGTKKYIRAKEWRLGFSSPVAQDTWDELVTNSPPSDNDTATKDAFEAYGKRLIDKASRQPDAFPSLKVQLDGLAKGLGTRAELLAEKPEVIANLIITSSPKASRFDSSDKGGEREIVLRANGSLLAFDSPFSQTDWNMALARSSRESAKVVNAEQLLTLAKALAERAILDPVFQRGMVSVENWLKRFRDNSPSLAAQGIVCAGRVLDNVSITNNIIRDCEVGIRVATSHSKDETYASTSINIENNRMELLAPSASFYAAYGMFIGNAETIRIQGNDMMLSTKPNFKKFFAQGVRIWGYLGRSILVSKNRIAMATMGIRLHHEPADISGAYLWIFSQNLIEGPKSTRAYKVVPTGVVIDEHNVVNNRL